MLKQGLCQLLKRIVYSNLYVVFVVGALVWQTYLLVGEKVNVDYLSFVMSSTLFLYPFHRLIGALKMTSDKRTERIEWAYEHQIAMVPMIISGAILSLYYFFQIDAQLRWWIVPLAILSLGYSLPLPFKKVKYKRIRDVPYVKIYAIALTVTLVTLLFPLFEFNLRLEELVLLSLGRVLLLVALTIPFDIRDVDLDRPYQIKTIPLSIGVERSIQLAVLLLTAFSITHFLLYFFFKTFTIYVFLALLISDFYAAIWLKKVKKGQQEVFYVFAIEGVFVVQTLLIYLALFL